MENNKKELIQPLKEKEDSDFTKELNKFRDDKEAFVYYFSKLNSSGLDTVLKEYHTYDGFSKSQILTLLRNEFASFKNENIPYLKPIPGVCFGCKKGCEGFTFLDEVKGFYVDLIIEMKDSEIVNFMECFNFKNDIEVPNKIEQIVLNPHSNFLEEGDNIPF